MVYHIQVHPLSVDTITIYPHDCTVGKSCNIFIYQFQRTLSLPELKNMKWQAQRALHLHSLGHFRTSKVDEIEVGTATFESLMVS